MVTHPLVLLYVSDYGQFVWASKMQDLVPVYLRAKTLGPVLRRESPKPYSSVESSFFLFAKS